MKNKKKYDFPIFVEKSGDGFVGDIAISVSDAT